MLRLRETATLGIHGRSDSGLPFVSVLDVSDVLVPVDLSPNQLTCYSHVDNVTLTSSSNTCRSTVRDLYLSAVVTNLCCRYVLRIQDVRRCCSLCLLFTVHVL